MGRLNGRFLFGVALVAGICIGWFIRFPPTDSASAAGWAQAVGTVAAIVGTVIVTRMQMRHAVEREALARKRDREERLRGVVEVVRKLYLASGRAQKVIRQRMDSQTDFREAIHGFSALASGGVKALGEIPLHVPPYTSIAREIIVMQRAIYLYDRRISKLLVPQVDQAVQVNKAEAIVTRMAREMDLLRGRVDRVIAAGVDLDGGD
jgi:hypothetical protein